MMRALSPLRRRTRAEGSTLRAAIQLASERKAAARSSEPPQKPSTGDSSSAPASFGIGRPPGRAFCRFTLLEHAIDDRDCLFEIADGVLELQPLLAQGFQAFPEFGR